MRRLAPLALLLAAPAMAQDEPPKPAWVGVWQGTVGTYPVRLCIDVWGGGGGPHGAYYYTSKLVPIALNDEDGGWVEQDDIGMDAHWVFAEQSATRLKGTWKKGTGSLPFDLAPVAWNEPEWGGPCGSDAFMAPRIGGGRIVTSESALGDFRYTVRSYKPAAHFGDDIGVEVFTYPGSEPGDDAIRTVLDAYLPKDTMKDAFVECVAASLGSVGADGFFDQTVTPSLLSKAYVAFEEANGNFCGGAHPNYYTIDHTFDRATGAEVDLRGWIGPLPAEDEAWTLPPALHKLVVARWPSDADQECRDLAEETEYWSLGLAEDGLVFRPDFPHVATVCEEPITVEWAALAPFLNAEGKAGLARLRE